MFGRATIRLGIGPHFSFLLLCGLRLRLRLDLGLGLGSRLVLGSAIGYG